MIKVSAPAEKLRNLYLVCGDQLDAESAVFDDFDPDQDALLMTEAGHEATYIPQHKRRIAFFFTAMRHFRDAQREVGRPVIYWQIDDDDAPETLAEGLHRALDAHQPQRIAMVQPGDYRVLTDLTEAAAQDGYELEILEDRHFFSTPDEFADFIEGRKRIVLEDFYRMLRKRTGILLDDAGQPEGGAWNFDKENRKTFGKSGPGLVPRRAAFEPDPLTQEVLDIVAARFGDSPGTLDGFAEPVTRADALAALEDFIDGRLCEFGMYQDAMWEGASTLYHSRLSAVMNLKLLSPREACMAAVAAYEDGKAPINAVEGFVRQVLGWREFSRGIYWTMMPDYAERNTLEAKNPMPDFYWTGKTEMACLRDMLSRLLASGYAHHIERLMGTGLYLLLRGTDPKAAHEWHMSMYLDAIDWVSLPNMSGMSQHADDGVMGTKPYCASGSYINRMSNYCGECRYNPAHATGEQACPFTVLYWSFLDRHEKRFSTNRRMSLQLANLRRKSEAERAEMCQLAETLLGS